MKIAISATGPSLDAEVDPRFGRCKFFLIMDPDTMDFESIDNGGVAASGGAGIAAAQAVLNKDVQAVLTGNVGPNAHEVLSNAGIEVFTGASGKIQGAVEAYKKGGVKSASGPTVEAHAGMAAAPSASSSSPSDIRNDIEVLKGRANTMKQQLDNLMFRIDEIEKKIQ